LRCVQGAEAAAARGRASLVGCRGRRFGRTAWLGMVIHWGEARFALPTAWLCMVIHWGEARFALPTAWLCMVIHWGEARFAPTPWRFVPPVSFPRTRESSIATATLVSAILSIAEGEAKDLRGFSSKILRALRALRMTVGAPPACGRSSRIEDQRLARGRYPPHDRYRSTTELFRDAQIDLAALRDTCEIDPLLKGVCSIAVRPEKHRRDAGLRQ